MATSVKNLAMSLSAQQLGAGGQLAQQVDDETDEKKKKAMAAAQAAGAQTPSMLAAKMLLGP